MPQLLTPAEYLGLPAQPGDHKISYGSLPDQYGELYLPAAAPLASGYPVVLLLHGGCWRQRFDAAPLGAAARTLTQYGLAVWNLEYRRLDGAGGWATTFHDAGAGMDFLRELAHDYQLDTKRVTCVGHSAGGHLALWLAGRPKLSEKSELHSADPLAPMAVVSLAGIGNLEDALSIGICAGAPGQLMGGTAEQFADRYAQGSPHHLLPFGIPQWHVVGSEDPLVPAAHVQEFVAAAQLAGDEPELRIVPDVGHFEVVMPQSTAWPQVENAILACFGLAVNAA